jgi:hypothetical protein
MTQLASRLQLNWLECSAVTQQNLKEVFDLAILHALCHQRRLVQQPNAAALLVAEKVALMEKEKQAKNGTAAGNGLKQNFWRLVAMTKKKFM